MEQVDDLVYYDSNSDTAATTATAAAAAADVDDDTFRDATQVEDVIEDNNDDEATIYGEPVNNEFIAQVRKRMELQE